METVQISFRDGQVHDARSWLYVWWSVTRAEVVCVGATGLPPVLRAWLHLHDDDPEVARMADRYPEALTEPLEVIAFRLPDELARPAAKAELIRRLDRNRLLGRGYVGDKPGQTEATDHLGTIVNEMVEYVVDRLAN
jgi:hypothetical protein